MYVISSYMEYMATLHKLLVCYYVVIFFNTEENLKKNFSLFCLKWFPMPFMGLGSVPKLF